MQFFKHLFCSKEIFVAFVFYLNVREYSCDFLLALKSLKVFSVSVMKLIGAWNYWLKLQEDHKDLVTKHLKQSAPKLIVKKKNWNR